MTFLVESNKYLEVCQSIKKLDTLTLKAYCIDFKQFQEFLTFNNCQALEDINKRTLNQYIELLSKKYAVKTVKRKMASLKAFFHYLEMEEIVTVSPFRKVKYNAREARRLPKSLSIFEVEKLIAYIYSSTSQDIGVKDKVKTSLTKVRDIAVFELMFATGLRVSELCKLTIKDVDLETQNVRILGKGNKERLIHISNAYVLMSLREYVLKRPNTDSDALFINRTGQNLSEQSVRFFIKRIGKKVLNKLVTPHMIRHSFATLMLEEGVDIRYIQTFLGHSSITTTQIYTHSTTVKQKQIMLNFHPRNRIIVKD